MSHRKSAAITAALALTAAIGIPAAAQDATIEVVAEGLEAPRGLAIAADGSILLAEAGTAGDTCPDGEAGFCFGPTGAVTRITDGVAERIVTGLTSAGSGPEIVGPSDVAIIDDDTFYIATNYGGDPAERPEGDLSGYLLSASSDGSVEPIADVAAYETSDDPDAEFSGGVPDANPQSIAIGEGGVAVADAGSNALLMVDDAGVVSLVALFPPFEWEFPAEMLAAMGPPPGEGGPPAPEGEEMAEMAEGEATEMAEGDGAEGPPSGMIPVPIQSVPTTVVVGPDGAFYVGELTGGPFPVGGARVHRVVPGEEPTVYASGFSAIMDMGFGPDGTLYVAELVHDGLMGVFAGEAPPIGALLSVPPGGGEPQMVATGEQMMAPGGIAVAEDGAIYVTTNTMAPGAGMLVKVTP